METKAVYDMIDAYHFSGKEPLRDTVFSALKKKPKILERKTIFERFLKKLKKQIHTFDDHIGGLLPN
ncbi:MAG: type I restriction enzyme R subunit [bacterium]|jgi:type I restriction enzyme R subunit